MRRQAAQSLRLARCHLQRLGLLSHRLALGEQGRLRAREQRLGDVLLSGFIWFVGFVRLLRLTGFLEFLRLIEFLLDGFLTATPLSEITVRSEDFMVEDPPKL